jgi:hypothetical protein
LRTQQGDTGQADGVSEGFYEGGFADAWRTPDEDGANGGNVEEEVNKFAGNEGFGSIHEGFL